MKLQLMRNVQRWLNGFCPQNMSLYIQVPESVHRLAYQTFGKTFTKNFVSSKKQLNKNVFYKICSGPNGVWTMENKGEKPTINISFEDAIPTKTHMALKALIESGHIRYIISQNIDGLHLKSGISRQYLSELHGNMFIENCTKCRR